MNYWLPLTSLLFFWLQLTLIKLIMASYVWHLLKRKKSKYKNEPSDLIQDLSANSHNKPCWAPAQLAMCYLTLGNVFFFFYARKMCVHLSYFSVKDVLCSSECLQWLDLNGSASKVILLLFSLFRRGSWLWSIETVLANRVCLSSLCHQNIQTFS